MFSRDKCIQSEYIQIECFRVANVFNLNTFILNVSDVLKLNVFSFNSMAIRAGDDESSEDGLNVESEYSDEEQSAENTYLGGDEAAVDDATTSKEPSHTNEYSARESLICPYYDPPIVTFDGSDWNNIIGPRGQKFAIGADSFNKDSKYYTKENTPTDVFGALMFMMSASLEHHSVSDEHSSLIDEQLVSIKRSSYPKDNRTPKFIHTNCFGKPNKIFCRFVIEYIAMSLFFDYWGEHSASSGPAPYNNVSTYFILRPHIKLIVSKLNTLNFDCCTVFRTRTFRPKFTRVSVGICCCWLSFVTLSILLGHKHYLVRL